ncbi:endonuclease/exonuclease/phosphatase family protein [Pseudomonas kuykendallii]|uniref:Metal-dependent hydrolase, endonuclease/exonuclease/phosphatase family n=1 Tax=Pseudomonas kuykendallii TaxID=1007099 RepID=A0A1H3DGZ5_9PSED|nr:endonuclease/exonuclease/phosphatase family protein [Pseudomonas kuykendallii]MCQ4270307.1 endonuclease/exonuclease/phosphatase family protein [Pseudomonas kuykendallii]SDX64969.1 Metal-dependent hydrolase, endonuclease/exonuclease/phosphatase family [Pseudomonas kuykendallii]
MNLQSSQLDAHLASSVHSLKVLTVNTHKGFTLFNRRFILPELRDAVRSISADIVFLQEVHGTHEKHALRFPDWPATSQYEFLADSMWSDFAYGRNAVYQDGDHGNALLSKFPILRYQNLDVSISGPERRGLLHCELQVPGHDAFHAICVHLGLREAHRQQQLGLLCELISSLPPDAPVVVAGDFNDWRLKASPVLERGANMHEAFAREHGIVARSFPAHWPLLRLDRVYVRNATTRNPQVLSNRPWSHLSDHVPLAVEIHL